MLDLLPKGKVSIKLHGNDGYNPDIKWMQPAEGEETEICVFRGKGYGGEKTVYRILSYFGVDSEDLESIMGADEYTKQYKNVTVSANDDDGHRQIKIRMDVTV